MKDQIYIRVHLAQAIRDWIHEQPALTKCNMGADECPDWPLAFELADKIVPVVKRDILPILMEQLGAPNMDLTELEEGLAWL